MLLKPSPELLAFMSEFFEGVAEGSEPRLRDTAKAGLAGAFENDPCSCSSEVD